ncbi:MAG: hypothetical protein QG587_1630 [Chloroflexota bacterium]|nr:hypothetical protein [Chloroflexota bacterium]
MDLSALLSIALGLIGAWALLVVVLWVFRPRDVSAGELVRVVPDVLRLVRDLLADRTVNVGVRISLVFLLAWLVSPVDLVPEFIPVLGPLDDVIVTIIVLRYARRRLGEDDLRRRWRGTPEGFGLLTGILGS